MNLTYKSIAYAFIANGIQVYFTDNSGYDFLAVRLECMDCGKPWYVNLTECFLCGAINQYIYECPNCHKFFSITGSVKRCSYCNEKLKQTCFNKECLSNKNSELYKYINNFGGVFSKDSGLQISQCFCLKCGSPYHIYNTKRIYVENIENKYENDVINLKCLQSGNNLLKNSYIILRMKKNNIILYKTIISDKLLDGGKIILNGFTSHFFNIKNQIFDFSS